MRKLLVSLAVLPCLAPQALRAADLPLASRIDRVTVYPDAAVVTRIAEADLPAGASTLTLVNLPAGLDPGSVRVEARGTGAFMIGAVDVRLAPAETKPAVDPASEDRLARLREVRDQLTVRLSTLETKKASIERFALVGSDKSGPDGRALEPAQWQAAWDAIDKGLGAVQEEIRTLHAKLQPTEAEIRAIENTRPAGRVGEPRRDVLIAVEAPGALKGELTVTYRVKDAAWTPTYDASLDTGAAGRPSALDFVRRAGVVQHTGEDWTDVSLSVSTAQVSRSAVAPELQPLQVSFYEPPAVYTQSRSAAAGYSSYPADLEKPMYQSSQAQRSSQLVYPPAPVPLAPPVAAVQQEASRDIGSFSATFQVPGRVTIAQDGLAKTFVLGTTHPAVQLTVAAAPELDDTAYLSAAFTIADEAPLLAGEVSLHRNGAFVGRTRVTTTPPGETVALGFGADERVKVERVPVRRRENDPTSANQTKTDLWAFKTTLHNLHAEPMRVTVTDRLPYSENTAITVEQLRETTPPSGKTPDDRRGVLVWSYDLAPGETREIRLAYRLRWPADRELVLETRPVRPGSRP